MSNYKFVGAQNNVWECLLCGALTTGGESQVRHDNFHAALSRVSDDASWGSLLRPLKGSKPHPSFITPVAEE